MKHNIKSNGNVHVLLLRGAWLYKLQDTRLRHSLQLFNDNNHTKFLLTEFLFTAIMIDFSQRETG